MGYSFDSGRDGGSCATTFAAAIVTAPTSSRTNTTVFGSTFINGPPLVFSRHEAPILKTSVCYQYIKKSKKHNDYISNISDNSFSIPEAEFLNSIISSSVISVAWQSAL